MERTGRKKKSLARLSLAGFELATTGLRVSEAKGCVYCTGAGTNEENRQKLRKISEKLHTK